MLRDSNFVALIPGVPWFVAATVAAITHVSSLRKLSDVSAPGEKPVFIGARCLTPPFGVFSR